MKKWNKYDRTYKIFSLLNPKILKSNSGKYKIIKIPISVFKENGKIFKNIIIKKAQIAFKAAVE